MINIKDFNSIDEIIKAFKPAYLRNFGFKRSNGLALINTDKFTVALGNDAKIRYIDNGVWEVEEK